MPENVPGRLPIKNARGYFVFGYCPTSNYSTKRIFAESSCIYGSTLLEIVAMEVHPTCSCSCRNTKIPRSTPRKEGLVDFQEGAHSCRLSSACCKSLVLWDRRWQQGLPLACAPCVTYFVDRGLERGLCVKTFCTGQLSSMRARQLELSSAL